MIYDQCMQQLLTFIMTVVRGGREGEMVKECVCVCVTVSWVVCVRKMGLLRG